MNEKPKIAPGRFRLTQLQQKAGNGAPESGSIPEIYYLAGPTATGKSAVAQYIAQVTGYAVLSADSMAVYTDMDIGTAKPTREERESVEYFGIDIVNPDDEFSVGEYVEYVKRIEYDGPLIVVGGTGLYIKALTEGIESLPEINKESREHWQSYYKANGINALADELRRRNPLFYSMLSDLDNHRRVIRALELSDAGISRLPAGWRKYPAEDSGIGSKCADISVVVGLDMDRADRKRKIDARVERMYSMGLLEETAFICRKYCNFSRTAAKAIGYREAMDYLDGRITLDQAKEITAVRTRQYAKRQMTWFRRQACVDWILLESGNSIEEVGNQVLEKWRRYGPRFFPWS